MFKREELKKLIHWICERDAIRVRKEVLKQLAPWTKDPVLHAWRFCNVRRMDDKVSRWLLLDWYEKNGGSPRTMLIACALARNINLPATLEEIGYPTRWNKHAVLAKLEKRKRAGEQIFTGAYIINGARGGSKIVQVVDNIHHIASRMLDAGGSPILDKHSMEKTWKHINGMPGQGSFMAGQIVADLRWTGAMAPEDADTWAPQGPGSKRGMNRLLGYGNVHAASTQEFFQERLLSLMILLRLDDNAGAVLRERKLEAMDIQNCLCEFDKYRRVQLGQGTPRKKYVHKP